MAVIVYTLLLGLFLGQAPAIPSPSFQALVQRGQKALAANELAEAEAAFHQAREIEPNSAEVYYQLGEVFFRRGEWEKAIAHFRKAIELKPTEPQPYFRLAVLQTQLQRFHDAQQILNELLRAEPRYADAHFLLGSIAEEQDDNPQAEQHLRNYVRLRPDDPKGLAELGAVLLHQEKYQEGESLLKEALARDSTLGIAHYNLGLHYNLQSKHEQAKTHLEIAIRLLPTSADAQYQLGTVLARLNELGDAEKAFRKALELSPNQLESLYALGTLLSRMGRSEEAASLLAEHERRSAAALKERERIRRVSAYHMDAKRLLEEDRLEDASGKLDEILELDPDNDLAYYRRGQILFLRREFEPALASAQTAIERKSFEPAYHFLEALCWERLGQDDKAAAAYERVVGLADYADAYAALGRLELRRGNAEQATLRLRRAVTLEPEDPDFRIALAEALEKSGDWEEARKQRAEAEALRSRATRP